VSAQAFTSGVLAERAPTGAVSHNRSLRSSFLHRLAELVAWCRYFGSLNAVGVGGGFWPASGVVALGGTARASVRRLRYASRDDGLAANINRRRKDASITGIINAITGVAVTQARWITLPESCPHQAACAATMHEPITVTPAREHAAGAESLSSASDNPRGWRHASAKLGRPHV